MPGRICVDCGRVTSGASRCDAHETEHRARETARRRGARDRGAYDASHRRVRAQLVARVEETGEGCHWCDEPFADPARDVRADHLVPRRLGGTNDPSNYVPACATCNGSRGGTLAAPRPR